MDIKEKAATKTKKVLVKILMEGKCFIKELLCLFHHKNNTNFEFTKGDIIYIEMIYSNIYSIFIFNMLFLIQFEPLVEVPPFVFDEDTDRVF